MALARFPRAGISSGERDDRGGTESLVRSEVIPAMSLLAESIRVVEVGCVPKDVGACDAEQRVCEAMKLGHCSTMRGEAESGLTAVHQNLPFSNNPFDKVFPLF